MFEAIHKKRPNYSGRFWAFNISSKQQHHSVGFKKRLPFLIS